MTDPAATIRRLHQEHCPRGARCPHGASGRVGQCQHGSGPSSAPPFVCPMYAAISAGYRAAVGDCAEVVQEAQDRGRPAHTEFQRGAVIGLGTVKLTIKALAPEGPPADE